MNLDQFVRALPKAALHLRLAGAFKAQTFVKLARKNGVTLPTFSDIDELCPKLVGCHKVDDLVAPSVVDVDDFHLGIGKASKHVAKADEAMLLDHRVLAKLALNSLASTLLEISPSANGTEWSREINQILSNEEVGAGNSAVAPSADWQPTKNEWEETHIKTPEGKVEIHVYILRQKTGDADGACRHYRRSHSPTFGGRRSRKAQHCGHSVGGH